MANLDRTAVQGRGDSISGNKLPRWGNLFDGLSKQKPIIRWGATTTVIILGILTSFFLRFLIKSALAPALIVDLSVSSFMVGCLTGFLFTSYGEENATVGKVRDWAVGGLAGFTIANLSSLKALILDFASGPGPQQYALVVGVAITFAALGFFCMFFLRELFFNVLLAKSRAERGSLEGTQQAGFVALRLLAALPPSLLSGIDDVDSLMKDRKPEAERLRSLLYSPDVTKFLADADGCAEKGSNLDWDVVSNAATLNYYRTYYESGDSKDAQEEKASEWLMRALVMNPLHPDLSAKYADVLGMLEQYEAAVAVLERLDKTPEAPAYVKQWLGYFLLYIPGREDDAIRISMLYHDQFPSESDAIFNASCGYAQKYCKELGVTKQQKDVESEDRKMALKLLQESLDDDPDYAEHVRTVLIKRGETFCCLADDDEFRKIVGLDIKTDGLQKPSAR
jgi:tetratricopeptide (TPR) repeat protein